jgi:hypothetical protein
MLLLPALCVAPWLAAQDNEPDETPAATDTKADVEITVIGTRQLVDFDQLDSGRTTFTESAISILAPGFGDPNLLFETLPNVQYDSNQDRLTNATLQDLSPAQFSIAGGRVYDNQFVIDGIGANSVMDSVSRNPNNFNEVVGHPQTIYLEASLLEEATIFDSNVPAEFTGFSGGVVSFRVREPQPEFGFALGYSYTSDAWTQYLTANEDLTDPLPPRPKFEQERMEFRVDVPLREGLTSLFSFSRSLASVTKAPDQSLFGDTVRGSTSTRDNYLLKLRWELNSRSRLTFQTLWTPYEQEFLRSGTDTFNGGGLASFIELDHVFDHSELTVKLAYNASDSSRRSAPFFFMFRNTASTNWVPDSSRSAQLGGFGDIDSQQTDVSLHITQSFMLEWFDLRVGLQTARINAYRARPQNNGTFRNGVLLGESVAEGGTILRVNLDPSVDLTDPSIIQGEQILTQRIDYLAHEADVYLTTFGLWSEMSKDFYLFERFELSTRWGLRYDYDQFLGNHNLSPRFSTSIKLPFDAALTLGINRYYSRNMVAYKLRESYPDEFLYDRLPEISREFTPDFTGIIETRTYSDEWILREQNRSPRFSQSDLNTPYSDEISLALTIPLPVGQGRVKVMRRSNRDEFARQPGVTETFTAADGSIGTFTQYVVNNNGFTDYESLSLEWQGNWRSFVFDINATFSETKNGGATSFFSVVGDGDDSGDELVFYDGAVRPFNELTFIRENFSTPAVVNLNITRGLFNDRLVTNLNFRYRASFESIEASLIPNAEGSALLNEVVEVDGQTYEVYRDFNNPSILRLNANLRFNIYNGERGRLDMEVRIRNLTNDLPNTSASTANPYQRGRSFWMEMKYRF